MHEESSKVRETIAEIQSLLLETDIQYTHLIEIINRLFNAVEDIYDCFNAERIRADKLQARLDEIERTDSWKL